MRLLLLMMGFVVSLSLSSCKASSSQLATAKPDLITIVNDPQTTLVDVRVPEQFEKSTVQHGVNIPLAEIGDHLDFFRKQKQTVLYCNRGVQSKKALDFLKSKGINNVYFGKTMDNVTAIQHQKEKR